MRYVYIHITDTRETITRRWLRSAAGVCVVCSIVGLAGWHYVEVAEMFRIARRCEMCRICGSDDVVVNGEDAAMVCEACKEEAWTAADAAQADSWRVAEEVAL
jgi:hypothetical protein